MQFLSVFVLLLSVICAFCQMEELSQNSMYEDSGPGSAAASNQEEGGFQRNMRSDGKPSFIRFGKRAQPSFIRFGRSQPSFIRFGKRAQPSFIRFG